MNNIFRTEQIAPDTYRLVEGESVNCYLLTGKSRALLIDTGIGAGRLRETVDELTELPVDVVVTHMHCDHAGGVNWFDRYYVSQADLAPIYRLMSSRLAAHIMTPKGTILPFKPKHAKAVPVEDGHVFDLGGRKVVVLSVPGHTRGSIALIDVTNRMMFTGDNINRSLWMQLPGCTTLREWMDGGRLLLELSRVYAAWGGHEDGRLTPETMRRTYEMVELVEEQDNTFPPRTKVYPEENTTPNLVYNSCRKN